MADILWPTGMRAAGALNVSGGPQSNVSIFEADTGPPVTRRKSTTVVKKYSINFQALTRAERDIFVAWFQNTLKDGNLPFKWVDPMRGRVSGDIYYQNCRIVPNNGVGYSETRVTPDKYNLSFDLVLLP